jgi:hypothetical protein
MPQTYRQLLDDYAKRGELDNYREGVVATLGPNNDPLQFDDSVMNADAQTVLGKLSEYQAKHTKGYEVDRSGKQHVGPMAAGVANRAEWLKEAGIGLAEGAATAIPYAAATIGAGVVAPLTDGMSVREMADKAAASGSAPVKAVGEFFVDADKQIKDGQRDYNKEMLDLPLPERLSRSASNILGGLGTLAVAPLGFGEMGSPERARDLGKGLVQGPVGYYAGVLDPTMAVDTVAADPFAAILEVAPLATAVGSSARAAGAASKNAKAAKAWQHLANIVDPQDAPQTHQGAAPRGKRPSVGVDDALNVASESEASAIARRKLNPDIPLPESTGMSQALAKPEWSTQVGRGLRHAVLGSIVLEPTALLLGGGPAVGIAGAAMVPIARRTFAAIAKSRGRSVGEAQAAFDRAFNDPNAASDPDVADAISKIVINPVHDGKTSRAFTGAVSKMIEKGEQLIDTGIDAPQPSRLGVGFVTTLDGNIYRDPSQTIAWSQHVASSVNDTVRAHGLTILAREQKRIANAKKWALTGQERTAVNRARKWDADLTEATKGRERLVAKRAVVEEKLAQLEIPQERLDAIAGYRTAKAAAAEPLRNLNTLRDALTEYEHAKFINSSRLNRARALYKKTLAEVQDTMSPDALAKVEELTARLDDYEWGQEYQTWLGLNRQQSEMRASLNSANTSGTFEITYVAPTGAKSGRTAKRTAKYKNMRSFVRAFRESNTDVQPILEKAQRGIDLNAKENGVLRRHHALRMLIDESVMEFMLLDRERQGVLAKMDAVREASGMTPTETRRAIVNELTELRKQEAVAIKAAKRERGSRLWMEGEEAATVQNMLRAEEARVAAETTLAEVTPKIAQLVEMEREVGRMRDDANLQNRGERAAFGLMKRADEVDQQISVADAVAIEVEGLLNSAITTGSPEMQAAFGALGRADQIADAAAARKKANRADYPTNDADAMKKAGAADLEASRGKVSIMWAEHQVDEWVTQITDLAESLAPFAGPLDPKKVRRLFSMATLNNSLAHMANRRAVGAFVKYIAPDNKAAQSAISAIVGDLLGESLRSDVWREPVVNGVRFSAVVSDWISSLPVKEQQAIHAGTAKSLGDWVSDQIQSHRMQGAATAELARQMPAGLVDNQISPAALSLASAQTSYIDWVQGGRRASMAPFNVEEIRQMLIGDGTILADGTRHVAAKVMEQFAIDAVKQTGVAPYGDPAVAARLSSDGVKEWVATLSEFIDPIGQSVSGRNRLEAAGRNSKLGAVAMGVGAAGVAAGAVMGAPALAIGGGAAALAAKIARGQTGNYSSLSAFLDITKGDLKRTLGAAPEQVWVHRAMADALDAQLAMLKKSSGIETQMKMGLTALSIPTTFGNMMSNAVVYGIAHGKSPVALFNEMYQAAGEIHAWKNNELSPEQMMKWDSFAKSGLLETNFISDVMRDWGKGDPARGKAAQLADDTMRFFLTAYASQDGYAKAAAWSQQYDLFHATAQNLTPGYEIRGKIGHNKWSHMRRRADGLFEVRKGSKWVETAINEVEFADFISKTAAVWPAQTFFDFNQLPSFIKRGSGVFSLFSPLFGWAFKAVDLPGKPGIGSATVNYLPSSQWLTDDPKLLKMKAQEAMGLSIRRAVVMQSLLATNKNRTKQERELTDVMSYGIPQFSFVTPPSDESPGTFGPQGNIIPFEPSLVAMSLMVEFQMGVADLFGYTPDMPKQFANADAANLTPEQRDKVKLQRLWWRHLTGKGGTPADLVRLVGVGGGFGLPAISAALSSPYRDPNWGKIAANLASGFIGKSTVGAVDVFIGMVDPDNAMTTRNEVMGEDGPRPEDAYAWVIRVLAGIGAREIKDGRIENNFDNMVKKVKDNLVKEAKEKLAHLRNKLRSPDMTLERAEPIEAEIERIKEAIRQASKVGSLMARESKKAYTGRADEAPTGEE